MPTYTQEQEPVVWPQLSKDMEYAAQDEFHILPPRMKRLWKRMQELYAAPSTSLPFIPWSKEAEMRESWAAPSASQPLTPHEIGAFVGTHEFGPEQLKWFRFGEAAHGIKGVE